MTRKELAKQIYRMNKEFGIVTKSSEGLFVKRLLSGGGAAKAMSKPELISWYNNLKERI